MKFKNCISELIAKILLKQRSLNQIPFFLTWYNQIILFNQKILKYIKTQKFRRDKISDFFLSKY